MLDDEYHLEIGSDLFRYLCTELNSLVPDEDAACAVDGLSGGFKFSDEFPGELRGRENSVLLPCISLLRRLWSYRVSLVRGSPRSELAVWWEAVAESAPDWPGFQQERCSHEMSAIAEECDTTIKKLSNDLDELGEWH